MADITVTAANVLSQAGASINKDGNGGATETAGQAVYLDPNGLWQKAQADTAAHLGVVGGVPTRVGITLGPTALNQPAGVQEGGIINLGATLVVGTLYCVSAAAPGGIAPITDLASTNNILILGIAKTASLLDMAYKGAYPNGYTGIVKP